MANWKLIALKFVSFGLGFAIFCAAIGSWHLYNAHRWNSNALVARATRLEIQKLGDGVHLRWSYGLKNTTSDDYSLPASSDGALFRKAQSGSLIKETTELWDDTLRIPPHQEMSGVFDIVYKFSEWPDLENKLTHTTMSSDQPDKAMTDFVDKRLAENNGLVMFDYSKHFRIDMPKDLNKLTD